MEKSIMQRIYSIFKEFIYFIRWLCSYILSKKNHHKTPIFFDKDILVLGNGPSASELDFAGLIGRYDFCCVNFFCLRNNMFKQIKPKFYILIDTIFFKGKKAKEELWNMLESVDWPMYLITYNDITLPVENSNIIKMGINRNYYGGEFNGLKQLLFNRNIATIGYQNVIIAAIYFFVMERVSTKVYLAGVENDWHKEFYVDENNQVFSESVHFYGKEKMKWNCNKGEFYKCIYEYYMTAYQYHIMSEYAKGNGVSVYNTTMHSFIDVFDKKKI